MLHKDCACLMVADSFIRAICDVNHFGNYYATISVPIMEAVKKAMAFAEENHQPDEVVLSFDYCTQGVLFQVQGSQDCFQSDDFLLGRMLADDVVLSDDSSRVQMSFAVRGIDYGEAAQRISTLEHFYHPVSSRVLQM